jgi:hypothetical protein
MVFAGIRQTLKDIADILSAATEFLLQAKELLVALVSAVVWLLILVRLFLA